MNRVAFILIVISLVTLIIFILLDIFFVYRPVAEIKAQLDAAAAGALRAEAKIDTLIKESRNVVDTVVNGLLPQIQKAINDFDAAANSINTTAQDIDVTVKIIDAILTEVIAAILAIEKEIKKLFPHSGTITPIPNPPGLGISQFGALTTLRSYNGRLNSMKQQLLNQKQMKMQGVGNCNQNMQDSDSDSDS